MLTVLYNVPRKRSCWELILSFLGGYKHRNLAFLGIDFSGTRIVLLIIKEGIWSRLNRSRMRLKDKVVKDF